MSVTIQFKRGFLANINSGTFAQGEPLFATDTKDLFISDGTNKYIAGKVDFGLLTDRPANGTIGKLYFATDTKELFIDTGSNWIIVSGNDGYINTIDDIADGVNYVKSENNFDDTSVSKLNNAYNHITDTGESHTFIDQNVTTTSTPTFQNIIITGTPTQGNNVITKDYVDNIVKSIDWQESVIDNSITDPSTITPSENNRYIVPSGSIGVWSGKDNNIAVYKNSSWEYITPDVGTTVYVESTGGFNLFNGTSWIGFGSVVNHSSLSGLQGVGPDYYHLSQQQYIEATRNANATQNGLISETDFQKIPTLDEKNALSGTSGTPSATNKYVTNSDTRLSDSRTPLLHASTHMHGGTDEISTSTPTPNSIPKSNSAGNLNDWITVIDGGTI